MRVGTGLVAVLATAVAFAASSASAGTPAAQIAFVRGTNSESVWIAAANGTGARRLGAGVGPELSPNGAEVAASTVASKGPALVVYATAGGKHTFFDAALGEAEPLAWSADSRYLAVELMDGATARKTELAVIDTTTWQVQTIATGYIAQASFDPTGTGDEIVYAESTDQTFLKGVNLYEAAPTGGTPTRLTSDGRSLLPLWTAKGIVYDHETLRKNEAPVYQLWLLHGSSTRQLTHMKVSFLQSGLSPLAASASGNRLIAAFGGEDTDLAYIVQLSPFLVKPIKVKGQYVQPQGISSDGTTLLIDQGGFESPPSRGTIQTVRWGGTTATKVAKGDDASWNR